MPVEPLLNGARWPCCGTFWVDAVSLRKRPKEDYIVIRDRLMEWSYQAADPTRPPRRPEYGRLKHYPPVNSNEPPSWYCSRIAEFNWAMLLSGRRRIPEVRID
jgi:hypothetical protein